MEQLKVVNKEYLLEKRKSYGKYYEEKEVWLDTSERVPFLRFCSMDKLPWMKLRFTTRLGGVSSGVLSSLNLGWDRGDCRETVVKNYQRACEAMGVDASRLILSDQVHGHCVQYVGEKFQAGPQIRKKLEAVDGLITDQKGLTLATSFADCVPLFFADSECHLIASIHSGWKGTIQKIGAITVREMERRGSNAKNIVAVIGPSICQDCYEVGDEVAQEFRQSYPEDTWSEILEEGRKVEQGKKFAIEQKYQLDLWAANWWQLKTAGLLPENIHVSGVCTCCNSELLFSHRATGGKRGNLNGLMTIIE